MEISWISEQEGNPPGVKLFVSGDCRLLVPFYCRFPRLLAGDFPYLNLKTHLGNDFIRVEFYDAAWRKCAAVAAVAKMENRKKWKL